MRITSSTALVTGANRGLGRAFVVGLLERGARKVYAGVRNPEAVDLSGLDARRVEVVRLDITDEAAVAAVAAGASDVDLLVNNAGSNAFADVLDSDESVLRAEVETHLFGTLKVIRAMAPVLAVNGGGAIVDLLSAMSWFALPGDDTYHVAKAAEWALTNAVRLELSNQGTQVVAVHLGAADTDMTTGYAGPKSSPALVVQKALDGVESGSWEVLVDGWTQTVKTSLAGDPAGFYRGMTQNLGIDLPRL